jgi:hypothetical protein
MIENQAKKQTEMWRDDIHPDEIPTTDNVVVYAEDILAVSGQHSLAVRHVADVNGRGFQAVIFYNRDIIKSSDIYRAEDKLSFIYAASRGRWLFRKTLERIKDSLKKNDEEHEILKKPIRRAKTNHGNKRKTNRRK